MGLGRELPVAPPARHEAVIALSLVRLQVDPGRREVAVLALPLELQRLDSLLCYQAADPKIEIG